MKTTSPGKPIGEVVADSVARLMPKLSDEEWAARDAEIERAKLREAKAKLAEEYSERSSKLLQGSAPELVVEGVYSGRFDGRTEAARCLYGFGGENDPRQMRVLSGGVGCGKTWAAVRWLGDMGGPRPFFLRTGAFEAAGRYDRGLRMLWQTCSALVLDDLGAEYADGKGNLMADLDELFDVFSGRKARLVITTNMAPEDFRQRYSERILSRLRQHGRWKSVRDGDRRTAK